MFFSIVFTLSFLGSGILGAVPNRDTVIKDFHGREFIDGRREYLLEWTIDWRNRMMIFNITVATNGWVGFGFSKDGTMKDADMVIAGIHSNRRPYITDFHTDCHRELMADNKQDWNLLGSMEMGGKTSIQVSRLIDSCDSEDYPITEDLVFLLWAFGETDNIQYHHQNRGSYKLYLLDPVVHPAPSTSFLPKWRVSTNFTLTTRTTSYWCSVHKSPRSSTNQKHHLIQFKVVLENLQAVAVKHTHHIVLWRCFAPPGVDPRTIFEPLLAPYPGEECYITTSNLIPINLCRTIVYVWALGGRELVFPDHVGFPFMESPDEYYMLERHFDNPEGSGGITFESGVEAIYTPRLRPEEASSLMLSLDFFKIYIIPPGTQQYKIYSQCSPECTTAMFPRGGVNVFAIHTHTHVSGRKNKLHHYRNGKELPWIIKDDNYDFTFQTPRPLPRERKLLPGDHLSLECIYDDTWTNATTVGGFSTKDEMCLQVLYHTVPIPFSYCTSHISEDVSLGLLGVQNYTWDFHTEERIVTSPLSLRGQTLAHVADDLTQWTEQLRDAAINIGASHPQILVCPLTNPSQGSTQVDPASLGYAHQMMMGTYTQPIVAPGVRIIISRNPLLDVQFSRLRTCPAV